MPGGTQKKGEKMKRIVMLVVIGIMLVSLGGCFWGDGGHDRDGGYGAGGGHGRGEGGGGRHEENH